MKSNNGLQIIIRITVCVTMLSSLIGAFMLHSTPSHRESGSVLILVSVAAAVLWVLEEVVFHNHTRKYVAKLSTMISKTERDSLLNFPAPAIIIDSENVIVWYNRLFGRQVYSEEEAYGIDLTELMNIDMDKIYSSDGDLVCINAHFYKAKAIHTDVNGELSMVYFNDVTDYVELEYEFRMSHKAVIIITIDNFDELMSNIRESEKAHVVVEIEKLIEEFLENTTAVSKKVASDKFYVYMEERHLAPIIEQRFKILEQARKIAVGERSNLTLSIGVGRDGANLAESEKFAKQALEMCLGRGGDQVVIKNGDSITYYGGKAQQMEKTTRVKARVKAQALKEFMSTKERVVVMGHKITDVDALGAAIGIYRAGKTLGKPVHIVVNDPSTSIRPLMAGYINNPDYEPSMFIDRNQAMELVDDNTVVVVVDTNKPSYTECEELLYMTKTIVVLDHHRRGNEVIQNAVLSYVEPYASSTCEMVAEILQYFSDDLRLRNIEADCIYAGIMIDTNNFITRAGVRTFEAAAFLRRSGADMTRVRKMLRDNIDSYKARAEAVRTAEIYRGCFAIAKCPSEGLESTTVVGAQAANELLNIAGVKASFVLTTYNKEVYVSARAIDEVNVQVMMEKLGGGGHINIAGAQVKRPIDEVQDMLKEIIDELYQEEKGKK